MKTQRALAGFFILALLPLSTAHSEDIQTVFKRVQSSVMLVQAQEAGVGVSSNSTSGEIVQGVGVYLAGPQRIMTSAELVQVADWVEVGIEGGRTVSARIQSSTVLADVAVLELEQTPYNISGVNLADSDLVKNGDPIFIVSDIASAERHMRIGTVTGRRIPKNDKGDLVQDEFLEIDIPIKKFDTGTPVFNSNGDVVGIVSHTMWMNEGTGKGGFAVPSNLVRSLIKGPSFWSGVSGQLISGAIAKQFNLPQDKGLLVERVAHNSLADKFGLRGGTKTVVIDGQTYILGGDILLNVDGVSFAEDDSLRKVAKRLKTLGVSKRFYVELFRDGKRLKITSSFDR